MKEVLIGVSALLAGIAIQRYFFSNDDNSTLSRSQVKSALKPWAVWGPVNSGKTTFIKQLVNFSDLTQNGMLDLEKEPTGSKKIYSNITPIKFEATEFDVGTLTDLPGTDERLRDWISIAKEADNILYLVDISVVSGPTLKRIEKDLKALLSEFGESGQSGSQVNLSIVATHIDLTEYRNHPDARNAIAGMSAFRKLTELFPKERPPKIYAANLTDMDSFKGLVFDILRDLPAAE